MDKQPNAISSTNAMRTPDRDAPQEAAQECGELSSIAVDAVYGQPSDEQIHNALSITPLPLPDATPELLEALDHLGVALWDEPVTNVRKGSLLGLVVWVRTLPELRELLNQIKRVKGATRPLNC